MPEIDYAEFSQMWRDRVPTATIAQHFGLGASTVYVIRKRLGLSVRGRIAPLAERDPLPQEIEQWKAFFRQRHLDEMRVLG